MIVAPFLNSFRQAKAKTNRPVRDTPTPNDRSRGPPKTSDDERIDRLHEEVRERFRSSMKKPVEKQTKTFDVSPSSEGESMARPVMLIKAKAMPTPPPPPKKQQKSTVKTVSSVAAAGSSVSASRPAESSARDERCKPVKGTAAKQETSTQAKELFKDADAARFVSQNSNKKLMRLNGFSVQMDHSCARTLIRVKPIMLCFGVTHVALHIAFSAAFAVKRVTITSSITLRKFPKNFCLAALAP